MLRFKISTDVPITAEAAMARFDADLLTALKPPLLPMSLLRFDGSETGDKVRIRLGAPPLAQEWHALIVEHGEDAEKCYFVDVAERLPFPLKDWKHRHVILKKDGGCAIVDDISYSTGRWALDALMYPLIYGMFALRKRVYRKTMK